MPVATTIRTRTLDPIIPSDESNYAAVILAGGDGLRLSSFTRKVFGHHLPKQFCPLFAGETLLEWTMRRVSLLIPPERTITVLNRAHERFYAPILGNIPLIETASKVRRRKRRAWLAWSAACLLGILVMSTSIFYYLAKKV